MAFYGIDLGTTFCSVAVAERGVARVVPLERGAPTLASTVLLDGRDPTKLRAAVGRAATLRHRDLCTTFGDVPPGVTLVRGSKNHVGAAHAVAGGPPWWLGETALHATDVGALVLRGLDALVRRAPSMPPIDGVVVTHPQRFRNRERRATAQSVFLAGMRGVATLPEPDAAAYAYGLGRRVGARGATFLVFDFGGGTLDVTVMQRGPDGSTPRLDALASYGVQLGGLRIDEAVRDRLLDRYASQVDREDLSLDALTEESREALLALAEGMKIQLNQHAGGDVNPMARVASRTVSLTTRDGEALPPAVVKVTLGEFSQWIHETTERALDCAAEAVQLANLSWDALDEVFLVGGSSWLLPVQQGLRARCDRVRIFDDPEHPLNPATAVAAGAALYAERLAEGGDEGGFAYHGVIPDAFGVRAKEPDPNRAGERRDTLAVLVPALTRVPFEGRRTFRKRGGARVLPIEVLEGRSLAEATPLGRFEVTLDAAMPDGAPVEVVLRIGRDGVLSLAVRDPATDATHTVTLADAQGLYADDELEHRRALLAAVDVAVD